MHTNFRRLIVITPTAATRAELFSPSEYVVELTYCVQHSRSDLQYIQHGPKIWQFLKFRRCVIAQHFFLSFFPDVTRSVGRVRHGAFWVHMRGITYLMATFSCIRWLCWRVRGIILHLHFLYVFIITILRLLRKVEMSSRAAGPLLGSGSVHSDTASSDDCTADERSLTSCVWTHFPGGIWLYNYASLDRMLGLCWVRGLFVFSCDLPPALSADWLGVVFATAVTRRVDRVPK